MTGWLALGVYVLGLLLAFGLRTIVQWRRTGDAGWRLGSGSRWSVRWWSKLLFLAALVLGAAGPVAAVVGLDPLPPLDHAQVRGVGLVIALLGIAATLLAQIGMGTSWRIGVDENERTALVTTGVFALVRNPIYTAMCVTSLGLTLMVPNAVSLAATATLVLSLQFQVRAVEEPYLRHTHAGTYDRYAARVGRFLPGIGRRHERDWSRLEKHQPRDRG